MIRRFDTGSRRRRLALSDTPLEQAECIVEAMHATGLKRLIFISSMGIYGEVPGERYRSVLDPYRDSVAVIEATDLHDRAAGLVHHDETIA